MNILIADKLSEGALENLRAMGAAITYNPGLTADDLPDVVDDNEILVVRSTRVTASTIKAGKNLQLIIRAGAGYNTIDLDAAGERGVFVSNCPAKNTHAVAELVIGLMIAMDRRIVDAATDLRKGVWNKKEYSKADGLAGRTLGIIGLGAIGKAVARSAKGLGMQVIAWSRRFTEELAEEWDIGYCTTPRDLAEKADVITIHLAATPETTNFCDAEFFSHVKERAIFINTSRGNIVDAAALKKAMTQKQIRVALDVYENEPASGDKVFPDSDLAKAIVGTPHIGASTTQAAEAIADAVVDIVKAYENTGKPLNVVNVRKDSCECTTLIVTHVNKVGVLASVLTDIRQDDINIEEMENIIFANGKAATAMIQLDEEPSGDLLQRIKSHPEVMHISKKHHGEPGG